MYHKFSLIVVMLASASVFADVINFEDKTLATNSFYNGSDLAGGFTSGGAQFPNYYDDSFGVFWTGFSYSNVHDTTTPGYGNQYASITGAGAGGSGNYGVGYDSGGFGALAQITFPYAVRMQSIDVTNTTYAYLAIQNGDDGGNNLVRQFGASVKSHHVNEGVPDYFKLTITGANGDGDVVGSVDFLLADYTFANNADDYIVADWRSVDLSSLGNVKTLTFTMDSTDKGSGFINTPTYFALDDVTFVPEPGIVGLLGLSYLAASLVTRSRSKLRG